MATKPHVTGYDFPVAGVKKNRAVNLEEVAQAVTAAAALDIEASHISITGPAASTYAVTLAAPPASRIGETLTIQMISTTSTNAVTLALTNVIGGSAATSASFDAANETLVLMAAVGKWVVFKEHGVTLS